MQNVNLNNSPLQEFKLADDVLAIQDSIIMDDGKTCTCKGKANWIKNTLPLAQLINENKDRLK